MRIHVLSDLHTEFKFYTPCYDEPDVLVLAGDIGVHPKIVHTWASMYEGSKTQIVYVAGNHEFYNRHYEVWLERYRTEAAAIAPPMAGRLHFLEHDEAVIDGVRFLGCAAFANAWDQPGPNGEPALLGEQSRIAPDFWFFGHSHQATTIKLGKTLCLANPRWYPGESGTTGFGSTLMIDVQP